MDLVIGRGPIRLDRKSFVGGWALYGARGKKGSSDADRAVIHELISATCERTPIHVVGRIAAQHHCSYPTKNAELASGLEKHCCSFRSGPEIEMHIAGQQGTATEHGLIPAAVWIA